MLPKRISPNPLIVSSVEIRFTTNKKPNEILKTIYPRFIGELDQFEPSKLPDEIKKTIQYRFAPDYTFSNSKYKISFGPSSILFEVVSDYPLWDPYFNFISEYLEIFNEEAAFLTVDRIGLRYGSILEKKDEKIHIFTVLPSFKLDGYSSKCDNYSAIISRDENIQIRLQIVDNAESVRDNISTSGTYIDIDASLTESKTINAKEILKIVDQLHTEEKVLFFKLVNPAYLENLQPEY